MSDQEKEKTDSNGASSESLATVIIDALIDANIIKQEHFEKAVKIAIEEMDVRKAMGVW
jgi:hypothetical protein